MRYQKLDKGQVVVLATFHQQDGQIAADAHAPQRVGREHVFRRPAELEGLTGIAQGAYQAGDGVEHARRQAQIARRHQAAREGRAVGAQSAVDLSVALQKGTGRFALTRKMR